MTGEQISALLSRLLLSFLTKPWPGRTHAGLADRMDILDTDEVKEEIERFIEYLGAL